MPALSPRFDLTSMRIDGYQQKRLYDAGLPLMEHRKTVQLRDGQPETTVRGKARCISPVQTWVREQSRDLSGNVPSIDAVILQVGKVEISCSIHGAAPDRR